MLVNLGAMSVRMRFNEEKATQTAAYLLRKAGGTMSYLKLIKLLYLVDREALLRWGRPVTTDRFVSMPHGPVVSGIYDLISVGPDQCCSTWHQHIERCAQYDVRLATDIGVDELSAAEENLLDEIYAVHGSKSKWTLRDETHDLPEWRNPNGSSIPIEFEDVLRVNGQSEADIAAIVSELEQLQLVSLL
jgi:uncharacterized phage-associated protein